MPFLKISLLFLIMACSLPASANVSLYTDATMQKASCDLVADKDKDKKGDEAEEEEPDCE